MKPPTAWTAFLIALFGALGAAFGFAEFGPPGATVGAVIGAGIGFGFGATRDDRGRSSSDDTREDRILDLFLERRKLQERAGVARALDQLEDPGPSPSKLEAHRRAVRELYFAIGDLEIRRRLIAAERRLEAGVGGLGGGMPLFTELEARTGTREYM